MDQESPSAINDAARRHMAIEAMLKLCRPEKGGMMGSSVVDVLVFILEDMKEKSLPQHKK